MVYLLAVSLLWAFSFPLVGQLRDIDPLLVSFLRLAIALPVFLPLLRPAAVRTGEALWLMAIGAAQFGLMYAAYIAAFQFLQAHEVAILTIFTPIYVTLLWDARRRRFDGVAMLMALLAVVGAGVILYSEKQYSAALLGFVLMQLSNLCFAIGQLEYKRFRERRPAVSDHSVYAWLFIGAVAVNAVATSLSGGWADLGQISGAQWQVLLYLGLAASGLGFFWWNKGAASTPASTLAVVNNAKVPLAVAVSLLPIFGGQADWVRLAIGGGLMLVAGILCQQRSGRKTVA